MKCYRYKMNLFFLNIVTLIMFIPLIILMYIIYFNTFVYFISNLHILQFLCIYVLWMILHELIHYIGFRLDKNVNKKNVVLGIKFEKSICYCMCKQEIPKKTIFISLLLPLILIGIITFFVGIIINNLYLVLLSILNICGCSGDIVMTLFFFKLPSDIKYLDLDDPTSFNIITNKDINKKTLGLNLVDINDYDNPLAKDKRKIVISPFSTIILIILIIFTIISFIIY